MEQVCQGVFLIFFLLGLFSLENESKVLRAMDALSIVCTFVGIHTQQHEVSRYILALRIVKIRLFLKEVPALEEELQKFLSSLKVALKIVLPVACLIVVYSIVGLHLFGGNCHLI